MTNLVVAQTRTIRKALLLKTGQTTSYGSGSGADDGAFEIGIAKSYTVLTTGQYSGTTNITVNSKTDAKSNACVIDNNTGLMWSRTLSGSVGPTSTGTLPWTTTGSGGTAEGIFVYVAAANAAGLAGYSDWRAPNIYELFLLTDLEATTAAPNSTAFPVWSTAVATWSSTTTPSTTAQALSVNFLTGVAGSGTKTGVGLCALVRGPV